MSSRAITLVAACVLAACAPDSRVHHDESGARNTSFPGITEPIEICDPRSGAFTTNITNPFFPLPVCYRRVLEGVDQGTVEAVRITVLDETKVIAGITTLVVEEYETEDGEVIEISRNYFAQAVGGGVPPGATSPRDGTVCYFGEDVDIFNEDGTVTHDGAWLAVGSNRPGIVMPGDPQQGQAYLQEVAPGVAEDRAWHTKLAGDRLSVLEDTPLEPGALSSKTYERGIGLVRDGQVKLVSEEIVDECDCKPAE